MKTFLSRATIVAAALAVCLIATQGRAQNTARPSGTSVAVIDLGEVFDEHDRLKAQLEEVKTDIQAFEAYVRQERKKMETLAAQLKTLRPERPEYVEKEKQLAAMQADLQVQLRQKSREFLEREAKIRFNAYQEILQVVANFSQKFGIQLVIRFHRAQIDPAEPQSVQLGLNRPIVYQNSLDITDHIIQEIRVANPPAVSRRGPSIPGRQR